MGRSTTKIHQIPLVPMFKCLLALMPYLWVE